MPQGERGRRLLTGWFLRVAMYSARVRSKGLRQKPESRMLDGVVEASDGSPRI